MSWFLEEVLILWPGDKLRAPWIGSPARRSLPGCIAEIHNGLLEQGWKNGEMIKGLDLTEDWWPIEMCPVKYDFSNLYDACRPVFQDDEIIAVLVRVRKRRK